MATRRGRPVRSGIKRWRNDRAFASRVLSIAETRDTDDETTLTEAVYALTALAKEAVPSESLSESRLACLHRLALRARPSRLLRMLVSWRDNLPDRIVRRIQRRKDFEHIAELWWA